VCTHIPSPSPSETDSEDAVLNTNPSSFWGCASGSFRTLTVHCESPVKINLSKIILVRHTLLNENEVEVPSSVIDHGFLLLFNFSSPLHVLASSGHPQKERGKLLIYQDQPVITSPIPHALLLYMWELVTLIRHSTSCIRIICSSENPMDYLVVIP
jgi:hypothetical protein